MNITDKLFSCTVCSSCLPVKTWRLIIWWELSHSVWQRAKNKLWLISLSPPVCNLGWIFFISASCIVLPAEQTLCGSSVMIFHMIQILLELRHVTPLSVVLQRTRIFLKSYFKYLLSSSYLFRPRCINLNLLQTFTYWYFLVIMMLLETPQLQSAELHRCKWLFKYIT